MRHKFETIVSRLVCANEANGPLTGIDISDQFHPNQTTPDSTLRNLNAAFLISLCGKSHPLHLQAEHFINELEKQPSWKHAAGFYNKGLSLIKAEIELRCADDLNFRESLDKLCLWLGDSRNFLDHLETINNVWRVFFPEGVSLFKDRKGHIESVRGKRTIEITQLNSDPIHDPATEVLFTSNVLLTLPSPAMHINDLHLSIELIDKIRKIEKEDQAYWYDHPIHTGVEPEKNEALYGLRGLDQAIEFEKRRGTVRKDVRVPCVLSISVTHEGLREFARPYLERILGEARGINNLRLFAMSEMDTSRLVREIIAPAARHYFGEKDDNLLYEIIGVDGEYGRHYSFLKAISVFWHVLLDSRIRATFKIDLDQVFPQKELILESGNSALGHFKTPLWGAEGVDEDGNVVELAMIAGALVNQKDIMHSLFTPDTGYPDEDIKGDEWIFFSSLPQAISTEAEMMTRYTDKRLNGRDRCIQRFHVTGGTCGILVESQRRYRPFTPSFIGRAEDQAYLLSVLFQDSKKNLRYVHKDGLIMRHDKEHFAEEAMKSVRIGKLIGDYTRILLFSHYARALPWSVKKTKHSIDPFSGCFVSYIPNTVVYLRLALRAASFFKGGKIKEGLGLLDTGIIRLGKAINDLGENPDVLKQKYLREKRAWNIFYDCLDEVEKGLMREDPFALDLKQKTHRLMKDCEIQI